MILTFIAAQVIEFLHQRTGSKIDQEQPLPIVVTERFVRAYARLRAT
ncbi:MAG: hypothetical protein ACRDIY_10530 [Chloroflexota bacterium]